MKKMTANTSSTLLLLIALLGNRVSTTLSQELSQRHDPSPIIYPGQVNIGLLADIHSAGPNGTGCGHLKQGAVQQAMAAVWAAHQVNFRKDDPQELNIGVYIYDTCGKEDVAQRQVYRLLGHVGHVQTTACTEKRIPPLFAVITEGDATNLRLPAKLLEAFSIPTISASKPPNEFLLPSENFLSTAPTTRGLARAAVTVLRQLRLLEVAVIAEDSPPTTLFTEFSREAEVAGMQAFPVDHPSVVGDPDDFLASLQVVSEYGKSRLKAVVFLVEPDQALDLLRSVDSHNFPQMPWVVITSSDITPTLLSSFKQEQLRRLQRVLLLSPETTKVPEFQEYFRQLLKDDTVKYHPLLVEFVRTVTGNPSVDEVPFIATTRRGGARVNDTTRGEEVDLGVLNYEEEDVSAVVKGVWTLAAALKMVQQRSCRRGTDCLLYLRRALSSYVLKAARTLNYQLDSSSGSAALDGARLKFKEDGTLASVKFSLKGFTHRGDMQEVGRYSDETGLSLDHVISPFNGFDFDQQEFGSKVTSSPDLLNKFKLQPGQVLAKPTSSPTMVDESNTQHDVASKIPNSSTFLPLEDDDFVTWKILDDSSMTLGSLTFPEMAKPTETRDEDLVENDASSDEENHVVDVERSVLNQSALNRYEPDFNIIVGPAYRSGQPSSSNFRSISLTSHHEPRMNDAFNPSRSHQVIPAISGDDPDQVLTLDQASLQAIPSPATEDVKMVNAVKHLHLSVWLGRPWALSILGLCGFGILVTLYILVFLMVKSCEGSLKKNNSTLAVSQLIALLLLYVAAALFTWKPSALLCGLQRLLPNVGYAFCFGCLLLKGMHLRAQSSLGLGGSVNRFNQLLTLFFVVGVQVALEVQWWIIHPPLMIQDTLECVTSKEEILESQCYVGFLLLMSVVMAISTRKVPYNYREGRSLIGTTLTCLAFFVAWGAACYLLPDSSSRNIAAPVALIVTSIVVLTGVFGPQLFAIHKYGGFPHKPLSYADSLSTVFTMFKDLDNASSGSTTGRGKKNAKTLETPFGGEVGEPTRNPLYSDYQSAYP